MSRYMVVMSLPGIENSPTFQFTLTAPSEDEAIDRAFNKAFAYYPEYGAFKVDSVIVE